MEEEIIRQSSASNPHAASNNSPSPSINPIPYISVPTYDPILIRHPIFQHQDDILLSVLIKGAKSLISNTPDLTAINSQAKIWLNWLVKIVFNNVDITSLKEEFQRLGLSFDTICGKFIGHDEIYFRCLDCDRFKDTTSSIYALLCSGCFDNSNHVGHRILMVKKDSNCSATCDCGDHTAFDPEGFCKDHQPKEFCIKETLNKFPQNFLQKFQFIMKNAFYGCLSLFELAYAANDKIKEALMVFAQLTLDATLSFCHICANQINESFLIVFGELFKTSFYVNYSHVWHYCEDVTAEKGPKAVDPNNPHPCDCKLAGCLLRLANVVEHDLQIKLHKVLVECAKEATFKVFIMKEFTKYLHYLYSQTYSNDDFDDNTNSRLLNMKAQLYGSEDLCVEALSSGYFQNFVGVMRKAIHNCHQANHEVYHIASDIRSALIYFLNDRSKTSSMILKNFSLISQVLEVLMNFQVKFFYEGQFNVGLHDHQVDYKCINRGLMIEKVISQVIEQGVRLISDFPEDEKLALLRRIAKEWLVCFDTTKMVLDEESRKGLVSFHPALERVFTSMLRSYGEELSEDSIMKFFREILPEVNVSNLSERVIKGALNSLGMVRFVHLVHNFKTGKIWQVYYFTNNLFFEMDVLTIQLMTISMNPKSIFETYIDSFFAYNEELKGFFNKPESLTADSERFKQKLLVLDDFLHFLIYVMNDETSRLNSKVCKDVNLASEEAELSSKCHGVIEKVLINLLLGHYWVDVPQLKETMKNVLIHHSDVDDILHKVAVFDEKNKKVRIKDEYESEFDPYIFFRNPSLQSDIVQNVTSRAKKDKPTDLVSGKFYKELPCYLKSIQKKLFQSSLPDFLANFLYSLQDHYAILVRPVLKLILTNLQVVEEAKNLPEYESLMAKVKSNYMNQNFAKKLSDLMNNTDLKDCKPCIEKIVKMVENLSCAQTASDFVNELKSTNTHEDQMAMKKKLAHQRMQQLKEEFLKKQKMFSHKNALHSHEENANEGGEVKKAEMLEEQVENTENELTCQFCLDKINKSVDGYGFPVYVSFTNNLYDLEQTEVKFEKDDHPDKLSGNWWPAISSCMHHYHEKCFKSHLKNSRSDKEGMDKLFANEFETYCSLCNTLCNAFVLEEAGKSTKVPDQEGKTDAIQEENNQEKSQEGLPLVDTVEKLLFKLKEKLKIDQYDAVEEETLVQIQLEEVFRKAYSYLLETFHVADKSSTLERTFTMYQAFIKEYLLYLKKNDYKPAEVKSLLSRIFYNEDFNHLDNNVEEKIIHFCNFTSEPLLNDISFECLIRLSTRNGDDIEELDAVNEHVKILREYIAFKTIQIVLYCKEEDPLTFRELYQLYKEDEELREDLVDELLFPLQKFVLASSLNRTIMYNGCQKANRELLEALLEDPIDDIPKYLDKLVKLAGFGDSFDKVIEESLNECNLKSQIILNSVNEILTHNTLNLTLSEPKSIKLAPRMIELPKNYLDFISVYLKKKCSCCNQFSKHMSSHICLICGDVTCLAYCGSNPVKLGNLNNHAKHYHLGTTAFVEIQKLSKSTVSVGKNSLYGGKDVYTDKLGQSIQTLMNDPRCLLYSLDFDKFTLNEDFVKNATEMVENNTMAREIYKMTKTAGYYYTDGNL